MATPLTPIVQEQSARCWINGSPSLWAWTGDSPERPRPPGRMQLGDQSAEVFKIPRVERNEAMLVIDGLRPFLSHGVGHLSIARAPGRQSLTTI